MSLDTEEDKAFFRKACAISLAIAEGGLTLIGTIYERPDFALSRAKGNDSDAKVAADVACSMADSLLDFRKCGCLTLEDLEIAEQKLECHWIEAHVYLMKRSKVQVNQMILGVRDGTRTITPGIQELIDRYDEQQRALSEEDDTAAP